MLHILALGLSHLYGIPPAEDSILMGKSKNTATKRDIPKIRMSRNVANIFEFFGISSKILRQLRINYLTQNISAISLP